MYNVQVNKTNQRVNGFKCDGARKFPHIIPQCKFHVYFEKSLIGYSCELIFSSTHKLHFLLHSSLFSLWIYGMELTYFKLQPDFQQPNPYNY